MNELLDDEGWEEAVDEEGNTYFYNASTGESQWEKVGLQQHINNSTYSNIDTCFISVLFTKQPTCYTVFRTSRVWDLNCVLL